MSAHTTLHYIYDPLCGWCYGAEPLVSAAARVLPVQMHGGGMIAGANRQPVSAQLRDYVMPHDRRIAEYTGQPFGHAYFEGLLRDTTAVFDSQPPIAAVLAAQQVADAGLAMLARVQQAHYVEGRRIAEHAVLNALAVELGLPAADFAEALNSVDSDSHIRGSRALLNSVGGQGFPTLVLEREGRLQLIDLGPFLGKPDAFVAWLEQRIDFSAAESAVSATSCGLDGCDSAQ